MKRIEFQNCSVINHKNDKLPLIAFYSYNPHILSAFSSRKLTKNHNLNRVTSSACHFRWRRAGRVTEIFRAVRST